MTWLGSYQFLAGAMFAFLFAGCYFEQRDYRSRQRRKFSAPPSHVRLIPKDEK